MLDRLTIERMQRAAGEGPILLALSGGGDSVSLLHLLAERFGARLRAAIVDHALRAGSAEDAQRARGFAEALGVPADVLTLVWPKAPKRAQQAAREVRYRVLCETARCYGARVLAVAHTADDQAETVLMRAAAGSGWRGLAGMAPLAPAPVWPEGRGVLVARPLLAARRDALRAWLRTSGAAWIEDPANTDASFERVRTRARLAELEQGGFDPLRVVGIAARLREQVERIDAAASKLIAEAAMFEGERILIDVAAWRGAGEVRRRALSVLLVAAAGASREPAADALERLEPRIGHDDFRGATLGGAVVAREGACVVLSRDRGALVGRADGAVAPAPFALPSGCEAVWDGRLALTAPEPGWEVHADNGAPAPSKGGVRLDLAAAAPHWLLEARVGHLLARD